MSHGYTARATYALEIPPGEILIAADKNVDLPADFPVSIKLSMAAIDPTVEPVIKGGYSAPRIPRSTLKMVRLGSLLDDEDDEDDDELREALMMEDESSDEGEPQTGPSNTKSKKTKNDIKKLTAALRKDAEASDEEVADEEDDDNSKPNGVKKNKGRAKATDGSESGDSDDDSDDSLDGAQTELTILCTLDIERNYQQPLDIIIPANENVGFIVTGTHSVFLTGNLVTHYEDGNEDDDSEDDEDYDLEPSLDELLEDDTDEESDVLDNQRVTEVDTDEEEAPKLVATKGKKRPAEEEADSLDGMIKADKLSKKQAKKAKNNKGEAVAAATTKEAKKEETKSDKAEKAEKKVQFAKNLEQGPTGSEAKQTNEKKATPSVTVVKGVKIDDRKIGSGRKVKNGDKIGVRYIGKLENGKVFDANKKGTPFGFKVGKGEVIKGWEIGVVGMAVGGERRLTIPPSLAYGTRNLPDIPANSTLIFDIKLLEIK